MEPGIAGEQDWYRDKESTRRSQRDQHMEPGIAGEHDSAPCKKGQWWVNSAPVAKTYYNIYKKQVYNTTMIPATM